MTKLQFDGKQYKLTMPKKLLEAIGWRKGDKINFELDEDRNILLRKNAQNKTK
jgi:bifunctional DNA-binding transcriptional regulator/antitoxin component of YhaV-PrlF toxin-antitoxin module